MTDLDSIREIVLRRRPELGGVVERLRDGPTSDEEVTQVQLALADELIEFGLDGADEERHNEYGRRVEALIDVANRSRPEFRP